LKGRAVQPLRFVLFDLDGTLIDSTDLIITSYEHTYKALGRIMSRDQIQADFGLPLRDTLARHFHGEDLERALKIYIEYNLRLHDAGVRQMQGVADLVQRLRTMQLRLGVVTSKMRDTAQRGLMLCRLDRAFEVLVAREDTRRHKPEAEPIIYALAALDAGAAECAYVGDSPMDIEAARAAGVRSIGALWRPVARKAFDDWRPDAFAATPQEAADILECWRAALDWVTDEEEAQGA
jgi:pyrophosphatase PpaX